MTTPSTPAVGLRIGEVAGRLGISERTLRYYDEIGLVTPLERRARTSRRYTDDDLQRIEYIRRLQEICGLNLNEIAEVIHARDRLDTLATGADSAAFDAAHAAEAIRLLTDLRDTVQQRLARTQRFLDDLDAKIARHQATLTP